MIPNQWYAILESRSLTAKKPVGVVRMGENLVLWRDNAGLVACMADRCAHRGTALSLGKVVNGTIACRYHGFRYNPEGQCVRIPCHGDDYRIPKSLRVKTYRVCEANGIIWLWWGDNREILPEPPWLTEIPKDPAESITRTDAWPFNYARIVENNFDVQHWAFLHGSIMLGVGDYFDSYNCEVEGDLIRTWGVLRRGNARSSKRGWDFAVSMRFPNLTMIQVTPRFRSLVIATPINETTSWVFVRCYQTYSRHFPLRQMIDSYCMSFLFAVPLYRQDFPVFQSQTPKYTDVGINKLVMCDEAIAKYLSRRKQLIEQARISELPNVAESGKIRELPVSNGHHRASVIATMPQATRHAERGIERPFRRGMAWSRSLINFPLLVPYLLASRVLGTAGDSKKD